MITPSPKGEGVITQTYHLKRNNKSSKDARLDIQKRGAKKINVTGECVPRKTVCVLISTYAVDEKFSEMLIRCLVIVYA